MKKIIWLGGIIIILIILFLAFKPAWKTYENGRYHFSVDYPTDWVLGEEETGNSGRVIYDQLEDGEVDCYAYGFANALQGATGEPQTLDEFINWLLDDTRVGEGLYTELVEKKNVIWDGQPAVWYIVWQDMNVKEAIYALNEEEGRGFFCSYKNMEIRDKYKNTFDKMVASWNLGLEPQEKVNFGTETCYQLLNGPHVSEPLKDYQEFIDTNYTEATITSREFWDKSKLPKQVIDLETKNYKCYPMPLEFSGGEPEGGVMPEPMVTKVQWTCELAYQDYQYLEMDSVVKTDLVKKGYECEKQSCFADKNGGEGEVWLCGI